MKSPLIVCIIALTCLLTGCHPIVGGHDRLQDGDLLFQIASTSDFSESIAKATHTDDGYDYDHVGIFACINGDSVVIEAISKGGVVLTPLNDFFSRSAKIDGKPGVVAMRINSDIPTNDCIKRAISHLGEAYDWEFTADNDKMYCSELVEVSFVDSAGNKLFETIPMNFKDSDGEMPQFWVDLFESMGKSIPQGQPGTNPNSIARSELLVEVLRFF